MAVLPNDPSTAIVEQTISPMIVDDNATSSAIAVASTFPAHDPAALTTLQNMFPAVTTAPVPIIEDLDERVKSRYLMIWNLPVYYVWQNVVEWTTAVLQRVGNPHLVRMVRTNESGFQIFWMRFQTVEGAQRFRGVVQGHLLRMDNTRVNCDFVHLNEYNGANGRSSDYWSLDDGLSHNRLITAAEFSDEYTRPMDAAPTLLSRLTIALDTPPTVPLIARLSKNARRRKNYNSRLAAVDGAL